MNKRILTLEGQKHLYESLVEIFQDITEEERTLILNSLGIDSTFWAENGGLNLDITSDKSTFITKDYNITLTGNLYAMFTEVNNTASSWNWTRDTGNSTEDTAWSVGKTNRILSLTQEDFDGKDTVKFSLTAIKNGISVSDSIILSTIQTLSQIQIKSTGNLFVENSPVNIVLSTESNKEVVSYEWYKGNIFVGGGSQYTIYPGDISVGSVAAIKVEVIFRDGSTATDTFSIPRIGSGRDGNQGLPGPSGTSTYTWVKYADGPAGEGISDSPLGAGGVTKEYIGMAINKTVPDESGNPEDYTWTKYVGDKGIPGENGYMWIKYSIWPLGRDTNGTVDMSDAPFTGSGDTREDMVYMGIAYNKQDITESNVPEDYTWSKIKGEDGHSGYVLDLSNDNVSIPTEADGSIPNPSIAFSTAVTDLVLYYGNDVVPRTEYTVVLTPTNVTFTASDVNHHIQINSMSQDVGSVLIKIMSTEAVPKQIASGTLNISKIKGSSIYEILPSVSAFNVQISTAGTVVVPDTIYAKVLQNTGSSVTEVTTGKLTYRFIYESTLGVDEDGTEIAIGTPLENITSSGNPLALEFKYFHPVTNTLIDRERIPFVRDGQDGISTEHRYQKTANVSTIPSVDVNNPTPAGWGLTPPSVSGTEVLWLITARKKADGSLVASWSSPVIISGAPGAQGAPGAPGIQGTQGPIVRLMEWVPGATYYRNTEFIDYIYYRTADSSTEGWYTVKPNTATTQIANASGSPDLTKFQKEIFTSSAMFGTVIAEQANLAGFIFRNQVLTSQATSTQVCDGTVRGPYPNLTIDGIQGIIKFLERLFLTKDGISMKDNCGKERIAFKLDETGVPVLVFKDKTGKIVWSAGQNGYQYIVTGTRPSTWDSFNMVRVNSLSSYDENSSITEFNSNISSEVLLDSLASSVESELYGVYEHIQFSCSGATTTSTPYSLVFTVNAFTNPNGATAYYVHKFNKGDMAVDLNKYVGIYLTEQSIEESQVSTAPAGTFPPDGWYIIEGIPYRGRNHSTLCSASEGVYPLLEAYISGTNEIRGYSIIPISYIKNGQILKTVDIYHEEISGI